MGAQRTHGRAGRRGLARSTSVRARTVLALKMLRLTSLLALAPFVYARAACAEPTPLATSTRALEVLVERACDAPVNPQP